MQFQKPSEEELSTESDVEQKLLYPLIISEAPSGLGLSGATILTKHNVRRLTIDKGEHQKSYYPDYMIVIAGFPLLVIEAKSPNEDLKKAYREARLYCSELNGIYPNGVNPVSLVLASDGRQFYAGHADTAQAVVELTFDELDPYSEKFAKLQNLIGYDALMKEFRRLSKIVKPTNLRKPRKLLGGLSIQNEEVGHNSFGSTVSASFSHIFNPQTRSDRAYIAKNGYIKSKRRERYIEPIDKVVRASMSPSETASQLIDDTGNPREIIKPLHRGRQLEHQVLLIVGGVGAGKTTFIDYLQDVALPEDIRKKTLWIHINMNSAPVSAKDIYDWLRTEIVSGCRRAYPEIDFDDLDIMKRLYSVEINKFNKGIGKLLKSNAGEFNRQLADKLNEADENLHNRARSYSRFCSTERGKLMIIVLDNCDKRTRDEQLLMFEAAQWLQKEFVALVILPLREETYDNHRSEPPLDTALKDLVFRIEPPLFHSVLVRRVQLALNELSSSQTKNFRFQLPNGFQVEYAASDQAYFLSAIVRSIFEYDFQIRRLIIGLSGRNIRRALEIFLEFCSSGYIGEDLILKILKAKGDYVIPLDLVVTVLVRMSRRFYDSDHSFLKNVFAADEKDQRPFYFTRLLILRWLFENWNQLGPTNLKGYFRIGDLCQELAVYGVEENAAKRELEYLAEGHCIIAEDLRTSDLTSDDLIRLAPAGFVHLELLGNVNYLAAIAEDTWFDNDTAREVAERIKSIQQQATEKTVLLNSEELLRYLSKERDEAAKVGLSLLKASKFESLTDLSISKAAVDKLRRNVGNDPWFDADERYPKKGVFASTIVNIRSDIGIFAELEPGIVGLVHRSRLPVDFMSQEELSVGEMIEVRVNAFDLARRRMTLELVRTLEPRLNI